MEIALLLNSSSEASSRSTTLSLQRHNIALLTRDQRLQIQTLRTLNWNYDKIAKHLRSLNINCTTYQVQYAANHRVTPQKRRCESKALLNISTRRRVADFIISSRRTRRMPFIQVSEELHLFVSEFVMRRIMQKEGIFRRLTRGKPPISEKNRLLRLAFANEHLNWTRLQWNVILWTNETWVTNGKHTR